MRLEGHGRGARRVENSLGFGGLAFRTLGLGTQLTVVEAICLHFKLETLAQLLTDSH